MAILKVLISWGFMVALVIPMRPALATGQAIIQGNPCPIGAAAKGWNKKKKTMNCAAIVVCVDGNPPTGPGGECEVKRCPGRSDAERVFVKKGESCPKKDTVLREFTGTAVVTKADFSGTKEWCHYYVEIERGDGVKLRLPRTGDRKYKGGSEMNKHECESRGVQNYIRDELFKKMIPGSKRSLWRTDYNYLTSDKDALFVEWNPSNRKKGGSGKFWFREKRACGGTHYGICSGSDVCKKNDRTGKYACSFVPPCERTSPPKWCSNPNLKID